MVEHQSGLVTLTLRGIIFSYVLHKVIGDIPYVTNLSWVVEPLWPGSETVANGGKRWLIRSTPQRYYIFICVTYGN